MEWMEKNPKEERQGHSSIHAQKVIGENTKRHGCAMYKNLENRTAISPLFPLMSSMLLLLLKPLAAEATFSGKLKSMFSSHLLCSQNCLLFVSNCYVCKQCLYSLCSFLSSMFKEEFFPYIVS